jgi:hypothetical protein
VDPTKVEAIRRIQKLMCEMMVQSLLGKINYLRWFISNMAGKVESLLPLVRLKHEEFSWGKPQREAFEHIKKYLTQPPVLRAPQEGREFKLYVVATDQIWGGGGGGFPKPKT